MPENRGAASAVLTFNHHASELSNSRIFANQHEWFKIDPDTALARPRGRENFAQALCKALKVLRWIIRGRHTGAFQGLLPTGKDFAWTGITIVRLEDGKLAANWVDQDLAGLMGQLRTQ